MKKKIKIFIVSIILLISIKSNAQITLDSIIHPWNGFGYDFYPVQISSTETKYFFQDTISNTFSLYNMDFSPFLLNISVPEPFALHSKFYEVIYISRTLFDCDSLTIEYAYSAQGGNGNNRTFYIMRTDGTQLFRKDSTVLPYVWGAQNGSAIIAPIMNSSSGTKLYIMHPQNTGNIEIYSLCGKLTDNVFEFTNSNPSFIKIFPNPTSKSLTFEINFPDNINEYELVIYDNISKELRREMVNFYNRRVTIDISNLNNGIYYYSLNTKNRSFQTGKFIITK